MTRVCTKIKGLVPLMILTALLLFGALPAQAQFSRDVTVLVHSTSKPSSAQGMILANGQLIRKADTEISKIDGSTYSVKFSYYRREAHNGNATATAQIIGKDGSVAYGNLVPLLWTRISNPLVELPLCDEETEVQPKVKRQFALIESLIEIRTKRRRFAKVKVKNILDAGFLKRLQRLERGFGLAINEPELSPKLPPAILNDRISRILHAVKTYDLFKAKRTAVN